MNLHEIKEELERRRDEKYREFSLSLTKDSALPMLGVRLPELRAMASSRRRTRAAFSNRATFRAWR